MDSKTEVTIGKTSDGHNAMVETATIIHEGREFTQGGAFYDGHYAVGYLKREGAGFIVASWKGETLGEARVIARWKTPFSFMSGEMFQVEARIGEVIYTGRGSGTGMIWKGKRKARQGFSPSRVYNFAKI